jgi:hypothetical protein
VFLPVFVQAGAANNPAVAEMMSGMDMSPDNMKRQLDAMGMSPDQFIQKVSHLLLSLLSFVDAAWAWRR